MRAYFALTLLILSACATRLYQLQTQSIWFDEGWSAFAAVQPTLISAIEADPTNPPLYYLLLNITTRAFGDSSFGLRWFSVMLGLLTIPLAYQLGRRLFDRRAGMYAAFLATFSGPLWWASQEARMYTLLALLVLLLALAWHRLLRQPTRWAWALLVLAELALLYAHNTGPVIVLWINIVTLLAWLSQRRLRRPDWRLWFASQLVIGLLWLPWFIARFLDVQAANSALVRRPEITGEYLARLWQTFWIAPWAMVGQEALLNGFVLVLLVLAAAIIRWRHKNARWLVLHSVLLVAGLLIGLSVIGNEMHGRYLVMMVPLLLVVVGAGLAVVRPVFLRYGLLAVFAVFFLANLVLAQNPAYQHDDVRAMARYYADTLTAEDSVVAWSYADRYDLAYYWRHLDIPAQRVTLPEGADLNEVAPLLPESGDVALNVWYTQRADFRGMMGCILGHGTTTPPVEHTVYGMSSQLYAAPSLELPVIRAFDRPVLDDGSSIARVTGVGEFSTTTADEALCVPVELRLEKDIAAELRAALIVRNALGQDIVQASAIFATANQRTSEQLDPGESLTAYALLRLPYGAPPGQYDILLRVFDEAVQPSGYDVVSETGEVVGKDLLLGQWNVEPGADWEATGRETSLPNRVGLSVSDTLTLIAHDLTAATLSPGEDVPISLLWQGNDPLPELTLSPGSGTWALPISPESAPRDAVMLDWRVFRVPLEAEAGPVSLSLPDGTALVEYTIDSLSFLTESPDFAVPVNERVPDVGDLAGYTSGEAVIGDGLPVRLVWLVGDTPIETSYTVFVQLLDASGQLIAQSDAIPAAGARPTTGWRAGEYIIDDHVLRFNDNATPGEATLIAGMYDARTGTRVPLDSTGRDYLTLPGTVTVR